MVSITKSMYFIVLLALVLTSCMARILPQGDENYNIGTNFQSIVRNFWQAHIAKRSPSIVIPSNPFPIRRSSRPPIQYIQR